MRTREEPGPAGGRGPRVPGRAARLPCVRARDAEATWEASLTEVLRRFGARRMVMGHTTTEGELRVRFGGRAVFIDTGLSTGYGRHLAALELRGAALFALTPAGRTPLVAAP